MTPEEKADYLINNLLRYEGDFDFENAVIDAIFCVDKIIEEIIEIDSAMSEAGLLYQNLKYWQEVKQELEKYDTTYT